MAGRTSAGARPAAATPPPTPTPAPAPSGGSGTATPSTGSKVGSGLRKAGGAVAGAATSPGSVADNGAGLILALLVWGWVILPLLQGGPSQVKDVVRAKFLNKASDGTWLP